MMVSVVVDLWLHLSNHNCINGDIGDINDYNRL